MTESRPLAGIIGACLTPFEPDGGVDGRQLASEVEFLVGHCDAVSVLGAEASEHRALPSEERRRWLRYGIERVAGRVPVLAGASGTRVAEVIELAEIAADSGGDYAQVLIPRAPSGPPPSTAELVAFFEAVAERSPLPLVAYHNPTYGADPPEEAFVRISEIDGVEAFKESSRDMGKIGRLIAAIELAGHARYFTTMEPLLATVLQGGAGAMMPPPATLIGAEVLTAVRAGDFERAIAAQQRFAVFPGRWRAYGLTPVMKSALRHLGLPLGDVSEPFGRIAPEDHDAIGRFISESGLAAQATSS